MIRRVMLLATLFALLQAATARGDEEAERRARADRVVLVKSATPRTGPLPPPAPLPAVRHPPGTWVTAARDLVKRAAADTKRGDREGKGGAGGDIGLDDDLPFWKEFGESEGLKDAPFNGHAEELKPAPKHGPKVAYDIPSIRATVKSVRFFESGDKVLPPAGRTYRQRFVDTESRIICWELHLTHPQPGRRRTFSIEAIWYRPDGTTQATRTFPTLLHSGWVNSTHHAGQPMIPGAWPSGTYRVDLSVGGQVVGSSSFHLVTTARLSDIRLKHNQRDPKGQPGFLIFYTLALEGRRDKETHVGVLFQLSNGEALRDYDGRFANTNGQVATRHVLRAKYDSTLWTQSQIFFPVKQLHMARGQHTVQLRLWVYDPKTTAVLATSNWIDFNVTQN